MEEFTKGSHTAPIIAILNRCRLYLQVITVSDITSADGSYILPEVKEGYRPRDRESTLHWLAQARPPNSDWKLWMQALTSLETRGRLTKPLGDWTKASHQQWFSHIDQNLIYYEHSPHRPWQHFPPIMRHTSRTTRAQAGPWYDTPSRCPQQPTGVLYPATKQDDPVALGNIFKVNSSSSPLISHTKIVSSEPGINHPYYTRLIGPVSNTAMHIGRLATAVQLGPLHIGCDGAHDPINLTSSHSWVIADQ